MFALVTGSNGHPAVEITLDAGDGSGKRKVVIEQEGPCGIGVRLEGCGMQEMEPGTGAPIYIEFYDGKPRCLVWADIRNPDPTDVIEMDKAMESFRGQEMPEDSPWHTLFGI